MSAQSSALDLLKLGDEGREVPLLSKFQVWPNVLGVFFGVGCGAIVNFGTRRPVFSGIHKHAIFTAGWLAVFNYAHKRRLDYYAEKDAVLRHYIELHPDDFKPPERKRIGELFEPWIPIR